MLRPFHTIFILIIGFIFLINPVFFQDSPAQSLTISLDHQDVTKPDSNQIELIIPTFLGNVQRNFYGQDPPDSLQVIWKLYLGKGETVISRKSGSRIWAGAGWTGQPLLVSEDGHKFLIQGAYDHHLKKIDARTGKIIWQYTFDDVVKGTGTLWRNIKADSVQNSLIILQGSRLGTEHYLDTKHVPSYRAISYFSGRELWRLDSKWTDSYSRDVDGSALILNDTAYIGLENSLFTIFDPNPVNARMKDSKKQPVIFRECKLYKPEDVISHQYNVVTESSASLLGNRIYITSGSGRVWGWNLTLNQLDWEFYIGSDMDGSAVITGDSCLMISVEKQFIKGQGGIFKLNPSKTGKDAVEWFFPTQNIELSSWEGGVIGSVGINDHYADSASVKLAAFMGIDGYLYVVKHQVILQDSVVLGPDSLTFYPTPELAFRKYIGPSISTPLMFKNRLIAAGYNGLGLYSYDQNLTFTLIDKINAPFEATPIVDNKKVFAASRDGYLYCLGKGVKR